MQHPNLKRQHDPKKTNHIPSFSITSRWPSFLLSQNGLPHASFISTKYGASTSNIQSKSLSSSYPLRMLFTRDEFPRLSWSNLSGSKKTTLSDNSIPSSLNDFLLHLLSETTLQSSCASSSNWENAISLRTLVGLEFSFQAELGVLSRIARALDFSPSVMEAESSSTKNNNFPIDPSSPASSRSPSPEPFGTDSLRAALSRDAVTEPEVHHVVRRLSTVRPKREKSPTGINSMLIKWTASSRSLRTIKLLLQSPKVMNKEFSQLSPVSEQSQLRIHTSFLSRDYRTLYLHSLGPGMDPTSFPRVTPYFANPVLSKFPH